MWQVQWESPGHQGYVYRPEICEVNPSKNPWLNRAGAMTRNNESRIANTLNLDFTEATSRTGSL